MRELPNEDSAWQDTKVRSSKYLNNMIEQDHRNVKARLGPMLGFKVFDYAATTVADVELMHRIRKGQFDLGCLRLQGLTTPAIWNAALAF
jgi:transposase-like protein